MLLSVSHSFKDSTYMPQEKKTNNQETKEGQNLQNSEHENLLKAHVLAQSDIDNDPDLNTEPEVGDDLDEGELARLEGEE
jgi:hypothetical protein